MLVDGKSYRTFVLEHYGKSKLTAKLVEMCIRDRDGKRVLISGCSHKGVLDIAQWFQPDVLVIGGSGSGKTRFWLKPSAPVRAV